MCKNIYDKSKTEKAAESWLTKNGFSFSVKKQYQSKTVYEIEKGGFTYTFELPYAISDVKLFMSLISDSFYMAEKLYS